MTDPRSGNCPPTSTSTFNPRSARAQNRCNQSALASRVAGRFTSNSVPYTTKYPTSRTLRPNALKKLTRSAPRLSIRLQTFVAQSILSLVNQNEANYASIESASTQIHHNWIYRRIALPIFALLRMGASPQKLAWSIAVGLLIGVNPILGSTTLLCLAVAFLFRLNVAASQIGNHIVYPLELLLVVPLIRLASRVFNTAPMPLFPKALLEAARHNPLALSRQLWLWEWHAFIVWAGIASIAIPLIALALTPLLHKLLLRVEHHQYPIIATD